MAFYNAISIGMTRKSFRKACHSEHERSVGTTGAEESPLNSSGAMSEEILRFTSFHSE